MIVHRKPINKTVVFTLLILGLAYSLNPNHAQAQLALPGQTALQNVASGPLHARAPGNLVQAGVAQAVNFGRGAAIGVEVSATEETPSARDLLFEAAITELFSQLNQAITLFHNLLLARAGRQPTLNLSDLSRTSGRSVQEKPTTPLWAGETDAGLFSPPFLEMFHFGQFDDAEAR
ncbi:MAG: hypothetical protein AABZ47_08590 [Planctomycetota bacterium]